MSPEQLYSGVSSVNWQRDTGDKWSVVTGQEQHGSSYLYGLAKTSNGMQVVNDFLRQGIQTGTYINEHPQVRFELEYEDLHGITHRTSYKKIVDLLEMEITRAKVLPIFYLADQPQHVAFASDLIN